MISPKTAHRVVGYLEEEAVHSCTEYVAGVDGTQSAGLPGMQTYRPVGAPSRR
jgi:ubiquinol oxidase